MGEWILKIPARVPDHACPKPDSVRDKFAVDSIWQCDCGARWKFVKRTIDQREGSWDTWELQNTEEMRQKGTVRKPDAPGVDDRFPYSAWR